jgi:hypothetical protein
MTTAGYAPEVAVLLSQPSHGLGDSVRKGMRRATERVGRRLNRNRIICSHAVKARPGDREPYSDRLGSVADKREDVYEGTRYHSHPAPVQTLRETLDPVEDVDCFITDIEDLSVDDVAGCFQHAAQLIYDILHVTVGAHDGLTARMHVETFTDHSPCFPWVSRMPGAPNVSWSRNRPSEVRICGGVQRSLGSDLAFAIQGVWSEIGIVLGSRIRLLVHKLGGDENKAFDGRLRARSIKQLLGSFVIYGVVFDVIAFHLSPRRKMVDHLRKERLDQTHDGVVVGHIALDPTGPAMRQLRGRDIEVAYLMPIGQEVLHEMRADKARTACDQDSHWLLSSNRHTLIDEAPIELQHWI